MPAEGGGEAEESDSTTGTAERGSQPLRRLKALREVGSPYISPERRVAEGRTKLCSVSFPDVHTAAAGS